VRCATLIYLLLSAFVSNAQKYKKIHQKAILVDTHNDALGAAVIRGFHLEDDLTQKSHSDLEGLKPVV
jgi:membrane dipeptidase